ncbi:hypothetical protein BN341_1850 [Helicobacter heilmannii ASB1.4]|uniref:Uncharacterized protein n=1 Tax=Helicobacter heilmannii TaxID=35817 RepID=A0A0K2Y4D5_HELHE|nr:hypothetical protein BN341_1850 [Helicobacter heilmannii ASB1.4]CRI33976.1 hypothetical protein HHE01_16620 [Helicobacter heilmannii]
MKMRAILAGTIRPLPILAQILLSASKLEQVLELGTKHCF